jgi:hypothetical protein
VNSGQLSASACAALDIRSLFARMQHALTVRPHFVAAVRALRRAGLKVCALTNNWRWEWDEKTQPPTKTGSALSGAGAAQYWLSMDAFYSEFDVV